MHETIIAANIVKEAEKHGKVEKIELEIGELAHVPPAELVECLKKLVNWDIEWKEMPSSVECKCGYEGHPTVLERGHDHFVIECPKCKEVPIVKGGTEVKIVSVEVK